GNREVACDAASAMMAARSGGTSGRSLSSTARITSVNIIFRTSGGIRTHHGDTGGYPGSAVIDYFAGPSTGRSPPLRGSHCLVSATAPLLTLWPARRAHLGEGFEVNPLYGTNRLS